MQSVVETLKTWQLHPFVDHFTVALLVIGILADLVASLFSSRLWMRYMALTLIVLGTLSAWGSNLTGGWEAERIWDLVTGPGKDVLQRHAWWGDILPWVFLVLALWRLGVQFIGFIAATRPIYILVALLTGVLILYQGYLGGKMVYEYGVGTEPMSHNASESSQPSSPPVETPMPEAPAPSLTPTPMPSVSESPTPAMGATSGTIAPPMPAGSPTSSPSETPPSPSPSETPSAAASSAPKNL